MRDLETCAACGKQPAHNSFQVFDMPPRAGGVDSTHLVRDAEAVAKFQAQHQLLEEPAGVRLWQTHRPVQRLAALQVLLRNMARYVMATFEAA